MPLPRTLATPTFALAAVLAATVATPARAAEAPSCAKVRMSDPGWTDITSTNAIAANLLAPLGYEQDMQQIAVPVGYQGLRTGKVDVFLGNWMPAQSALVDPLKAAGDIEVLNANLENVQTRANTSKCKKLYTMNDDHPVRIQHTYTP